MDFVVEKARAKTNLVLDIINRRSDGYHNLGTLFQSLDLFEEVKLTKTPSLGIQIDHDESILGGVENNLIYKAALLAQNLMGIPLNLQIECEKTLPMGAGLGGGSADAAATLRGIVRLYQINYDPEEWIQASAKLGADVPFMLRGGTQWARGIGELLSETKLPREVKEKKVLVITPHCFVSTQDAYRGVELAGEDRFNKFVESYQVDSLKSLKGLYNQFEVSVFPQYPLIANTVKRLKEFGAEQAIMSGSGASVIGIFASDYDTSLIDNSTANSFRFFAWTRFDGKSEMF